MFRTLVVSYNLISAEYYLHRMSNFELDLMAEELQFTARPIWDAARVLSMYVAAPYSKQKLNARKMFPLPWDKEGEDDFDEKSFLVHNRKMQELAKNL
jgi:hypothetical protein